MKEMKNLKAAGPAVERGRYGKLWELPEPSPQSNLPYLLAYFRNPPIFSLEVFFI
jgi:hypothetical protein